MQKADPLFSILQRNRWLLPPAILLGVGVGLFVSGYWLIDILPAGSKQSLFFTGLAGVLGALVYYLLLSWAKPRFSVFSVGPRLGLPVCSLLAGAFLFFGGTSQWVSSGRYVPFLLPSHELRISVKAAPGSGGDVAITWFNTSLGDVSYETIDVRGWKRVGDQLILENPTENGLQWSGRTGETVQLVFRVSDPNEKLSFSWDGHQELLTPASGKFNYVHTFDIPWYASRWLILGLGILISTSLAGALILLLWEKRRTLLDGISEAIRPAAEGAGATDAAVIVGILFLALLLRLPNLGSLFPAVDEYYHLIAARQILDGAALNSVYARGLWLVTLPVSLSLRAFGYQLWAARLTGVLFNVLAILPLYVLTRKINRPVGIIACLLYATSPWIITFARIAREYAYYPFYFYWIILGMVYFLQAVPQGFILLRQWKTMMRPKIILLGLGLLVPPLFALYGDRLSTFRTILIAYLVFAVFLLARFNLRHRLNWPVLALLCGSLLVAAQAWYETWKTKILPYPQFNSLPVEYFLPNPQQQWYFDRLVIVIALGLLGAALCSYLIRRNNFVPLFIFMLYSTYLLIFAFFSKTFFHTRHILTTELWFIVVVALGLYLIWMALEALGIWKSRSVGVVLAAVIGLSVINVRQVVMPITSTNPDNPISQDYLHDLTKVHAFMLTHAQPHDVLISTVYGLYSSWQEQPKFEAQYRITTQTPRQDVFSIIDQHESGWIVIDQIRLGLSSLGPRDFEGNADIHYIGLFDDQYVWHWQHTSGNLGNTAVPGKGQ